MSEWLINNEGKFQEFSGIINEKIVDFIQRLQTIKGEQSFNGGNGLDFLGILEGRKYSQIEINRIASHFTDYFTVEVKKTERDKEARALKIDLRLKLVNSEDLEYIDLNFILGGKK